MKKVMKRVITACLAFAMILALVTPASVEAATKNESLTLYKGETYTWYLTGVKSLSSAMPLSQLFEVLFDSSVVVKYPIF